MKIKIKEDFFLIAKGSLEETEECILIASEFKYIDDLTFETLMRQYWKCSNMLNKLISSLNSRGSK